MLNICPNVSLRRLDGEYNHHSFVLFPPVGPIVGEVQIHCQPYTTSDLPWKSDGHTRDPTSQRVRPVVQVLRTEYTEGSNLDKKSDIGQYHERKKSYIRA